MTNTRVKFAVGVFALLATCPLAKAQKGEDPPWSTTHHRQQFNGLGEITLPGFVGWGPSQNVGRIGGALTQFNDFSLGSNLQGAEAGPDIRDSASTRSARTYLGQGAIQSTLGSGYSGFGSTFQRRSGLGAGFGVALGNTPLAGAPQGQGGRRAYTPSFSISGIQYTPPARGLSGLPSLRPTLPQLSLDRNLMLRTQSRLGLLATGTRDSYGFDRGRAARASIPALATRGDNEPPALPAPPATPGVSASERLLRERQQRMAGYISRGDELLRAGEYDLARSAYNVASVAGSESPAPRLRLFIANLYTRDTNQATTYLRQAIIRAKTLDDLKLDVSAFSPSKEPFSLFPDRLSGLATKADPPAIELVVYAYVCWVNGDNSTALRQAEAATKKEFKPDGVDQFYELLSGSKLASKP